MGADLASFYAACHGVLASPDIDAALHALGASPTAGQIRAAVLPLIPEGNPPQYTRGAPPAMPLVMPGATPVLAAALPVYPAGLKRFADSNPDPRDGWSIEMDDDDDWGGGGGGSANAPKVAPAMPPVNPNPFILDQSRLDGPDVLA